MEETGKYIKEVVIEGLWRKYNLKWELNPHVNILAGINGSGKSTVLRSIRYGVKDINVEIIKIHVLGSFVYKYFKQVQNKIELSLIPDVPLKFILKLTYLNSFETELPSSDSVQKLSNESVKTTLDWLLYRELNNYKDYQLNIGKSIQDLLQEDPTKAKEALGTLFAKKERFFEMIDELFAESGKKIDRRSSDVILIHGEDKLTVYQLSSGEKQMILMLLMVLVQDNTASVLLLDEPELSLHIDWQKKLIGFLRELNPNCQLIIATHSPAIIMNGWTDCVTEMSDILTPISQVITS